MNILANVLGDIIHLFKIILVCSYFFKFDIYEDDNRVIRTIFVSVVMIIVSIFINLNSDEILNSILYVSSTIVFVSCIYEESCIRKILSTIWIIIVMSMIDIMSMVLVDMFIIVSKISIMDYTQLIASSLSLIFVASVGMVFKRKSDISLKSAHMGSMGVFTIIATVDAVIIMLMANFIETQYIDNVLLVLLFCMVVLGSFLQLSIIIMLFVQRNLYQRDKRITQKYLNEQISHYRYLETREKETKRFRHDINNHMKMLSNFIRSENYTEADKYLSRINYKLEQFGNTVTLHNEIVDAIINQYYSIAQDKYVNMEISGKFPKDCDIEAYDLCTIFSNILSNALEASVETEDKMVRMECRYDDENIIILLKNSFINNGQFNTGVIKSLKANKDYHGFGLENVRECINNNGGLFRTEIVGNEFILTILLKYKVIINEDSNCG